MVRRYQFYATTQNFANLFNIDGENHEISTEK